VPSPTFLATFLGKVLASDCQSVMPHSAHSTSIHLLYPNTMGEEDEGVDTGAVLEEGHAARVAGELDLWGGRFAAAAGHHVRAAECFERAAAAMDAAGPYRQMLTAYALVRVLYHPHFHSLPHPPASTDLDRCHVDFLQTGTVCCEACPMCGRGYACVCVCVCVCVFVCVCGV
jgi:hypothetical protein